MVSESGQDDYFPSEDESSDSGAASNSESEAGSGMDPASRSAQAVTHLEKDAPDEEALSAATSPSRKRRYTLDHAGAPLKRQRCTFNIDYLHLLNEDIADASVNLVVDSDSHLKPSQIGATRWTDVEKEVFFSALGRLGRDDLPGISARIGTKSQLEVQQYIMFLSERERTRRDEGGLRRKTLIPIDFPAATELSHDCCVALDQAADDLSLRQENHEVAIEEKKWGHQWLITQSTNGELGSQSHADMPFTEFFVVHNWLKLSERVFMNSRIPDYNWRYLSDEPPAIRATALSDFHALATSITKRLVASTLFMSGLRIKAKREHIQRTKAQVKAKDVKAAVDSLSMTPSSRNFWAKAPRRLRIDVLKDETHSDDEAEERRASDEEDVINYGEVEAALGMPKEEESSTSLFDDSPSGSDEDIEDEPSPCRDDDQPVEDVDVDIAIDDESVKRDMREAMFFSADYEGTTRARQVLQGRIVAEHRMEAEAEDHDVQASRQEEARLWTMLRQPGGPPATPARNEEIDWRGRRAVYEPVTTNWREGLSYVSQWEAAGSFPRSDA